MTNERPVLNEQATYSRYETAQLLGISVLAVQRLILMAALPVRLIDNELRISGTDIMNCWERLH